MLMMSCSSSPQNVKPIPDFNLSRYLGTWYEIARFDHSFERNLMNVSASYSLGKDGTVNVVNKGYNTITHQWKEAQATAYQESPPNVFKVYFIPLIAGNYVIEYLSPDYSQAIVSDGSPNYLWILSRNPKLSTKEYTQLREKAAQLGFDVSKLQYPIQI